MYERTIEGERKKERKGRMGEYCKRAEIHIIFSRFILAYMRCRRVCLANRNSRMKGSSDSRRARDYSLILRWRFRRL
jgi:hypothetical protein